MLTPENESSGATQEELFVLPPTKSNVYSFMMFHVTLAPRLTEYYCIL